MRIKIYGGTPVQAAESLCDSCRHSRIIRGRRLEEEIVICTAMLMDALQIRFTVTECTEYSDQREPSYHELCEKAWILRPETKRRPAGFVRAADLNSAEVRRLLAGHNDDT